MATEYNWSVAMTEYTKADGGIFTAHWRVSAVDGDYTASAYGSCGFNPDPAAPCFKPYDEVTEAEVLGWVWGSVDKDETEANLAAQIDAQKNPTSEAGLPWA
jgi:hypothetical protein